MNGDVENQPSESLVVEKTSLEEQIEVSETGNEYFFSVSDIQRFRQWLTALKIRYWIDFGNQDDYDVAWRRITNKRGEIVELNIKLYQDIQKQVRDAGNDSDCDDDVSDKQLIFVISIHLSKQKFTIKGNLKELWDQELKKLQSFVNGVCLKPELNTEDLSCLYREIFTDTSVTNLDGVSLNALDDSDCDDIEENSTSESPKKHGLKSPSTKSKVKSFRQIKVISSPRRKLYKKLATPHIEQKQILDFMEKTNSRINELEQFALKVDKVIASTDVDIIDIKNKLSNIKKDLSESLNSGMKHELSVIKQAQTNDRDEINNRFAKTNAELKRLQGRVGSLVDEKANLLKRIKYLEESNSKPQEDISSSVDNISEAIPRNETTCTESTFIHTTQEENPNSSTQENLIEDGTSLLDNGHIPVHTPEYDFVFLCDSNRKFINADQLYPKGKNKIIACGTTDKAIDILTWPRFNVKHGIIINTGVNDLEHLSTQEVTEKQQEMVEIATQKFPNKKIVMSSITPRCDQLDRSVFEVNKAVAKNIRNIQNVFLVDNGNLRCDQQSSHFDDKHLNRRHGIPLFAKNLKDGIRRALGIPVRKPADQTRTRNYPKEKTHNVHNPRSYSDAVINGSPAITPQTQSNPALSDVQHQLFDLTSMIRQLVQTNTNFPAPQQPILCPPFPTPGLVYGAPHFGIPPRQVK